MKQRILFVDGTSRELAEVLPQLASRANEWEWSYVVRSSEALEYLDRNDCDALVVDLQLDDRSGLQLATQVSSDHPQTHRLLLADLGDPQSLFRCVGGVHQFVAKPCDHERLAAILERAFAFQVWLPNQTVRALMGRLPNVPSTTRDYTEVVREFRQEQTSIERVAALIAQDPPMAAKVLQLANSAAYGPPLDEADVVTAVRDLGLTNVRGALLLAHTYSDLTDLPALGLPIDELWGHARRVSRLARCVAEAELADRPRVQQATTAGLLHDLGKLALAVNLPDQFRQRQELMRTRQLADYEAEQEIFGANHAEVAACLLATWSLPMPVIEAVAMHHHPAQFLSQAFSPLTAVHVANAFDGAANLDAARARLDVDYLRQLGLEPRLPAWWAACQSDMAAQVPPPPVKPPSHDGQTGSR
jgi:HD-like signal output (HDOD) protein